MHEDLTDGDLIAAELEGIRKGLELAARIAEKAKEPTPLRIAALVRRFREISHNVTELRLCEQGVV